MDCHVGLLPPRSDKTFNPTVIARNNVTKQSTYAVSSKGTTCFDTPQSYLDCHAGLRPPRRDEINCERHREQSAAIQGKTKNEWIASSKAPRNDLEVGDDLLERIKFLRMPFIPTRPREQSAAIQHSDFIDYTSRE